MIGNLLISFLLQIAFTVGMIVLFGFLIALCNKRFYNNMGSNSMLVCYITGAIGTPLHECAHALFCIIFAHKIKEIKLFQINSADGTLGYVSHTYNKKNIYQRVGNFFIGIAPIVVISAVLYLLAWLLLPSFIAKVNGSIQLSNDYLDVVGILKSIIKLVEEFFSCATMWQWWVFVLIGMFLALHMTLSKPDIQGALSGVLLLLIIVFVIDLILALISTSLINSFTQGVLNMAGYLICILMLALIISIIAVAISFIFRAIKRR